MSKSLDYLEVVGQVVLELERLGVKPILIGGMALVVMGSRRVTQDFDFLLSATVPIDDMLAVFYQKGFELASRLTQEGDVTATIDNQRVAKARLQLDQPSSVHFFNPKTELKIDLLFDFPLPASELALHAKRIKVGSYSFSIASKNDLLKLKKIAKKNRSLASDAQDVEFLQKKLKYSNRDKKD